MENYDMKRILNIFENCDSFSLTSTKPITQITEKHKKSAIDDLLCSTKNFLKEEYDYYSQEVKNLPKFESVFNDILEETKNFNNKINNDYAQGKLKEGQSPFICDYVGKDTKYSNPDGLYWHFYHSLQNYLNSLQKLETLKVVKNLEIKQLNTLENLPLKNNLINYQFTYGTHCTFGPLQLVFFFKLNQETKEWLKKFENDFSLLGSGLEDLGIYKNGELKFSSCSHEHLNSLQDNE